MSRCAQCGKQSTAGSRFCGVCGAEMPADPLQTQTSLPSEAVAVSASRPVGDDSRFLPGSMVAGRYRIVGMLGRGGMGEVYRADDLKLGQPVALKFLPPAVEKDPERLERFLNEVRLALRITHPNVCRVYDIGDVDGQHFISMEYVDGEDLSSLLRRIGRMPQERAVEIARQLCAGLAAAHDQGILHRDLKPANVMIDGRGRAKITDFGLASVEGTVKGAEVRAGTPSYMAPEQLQGREVTERSDLYALGLVLYEMFSGKPAFHARSVAEMLRLQQSETPSDMSNIRDIEPGVEQAVLRALSSDPARRPSSALALAAALPGGDPLAAALAAGETPSPEMVAEAGDTSEVSVPVVGMTLAAVLIGLFLIAWIRPQTRVLSLVETPLSVEALAERARLTAERLGYDETPVGMAHGVATDWDYVTWLREDSATMPQRIAAQRPSVFAVWYRQSPEPMAALLQSQDNRVTLSDPPMTVAGMVQVQVDPQGRLVEFGAVPPERDPSRESGGPEEEENSATTAVWATAFEEAGLDAERFSPIEPGWTPPHYADARAAWEGNFEELPDVVVRVEAAAYQGRLVSFEIIGPGARTRAESAPSGTTRVRNAIGGTLIFLVVGTLVVMGRRNIRLGRSDLEGARRVGLYVFVVECAGQVISFGNLADLHEAFGRVFLKIGMCIVLGLLAFTAYVSLEPYVRRLWPHVLISWTRLLSGRVRDVQVGRDLLVGAALGVLSRLLVVGHTLLPAILGLAEEPLGSSLDAVSVFPLPALSRICSNAGGSVGSPLITLVMLVVLRILFRRASLALVAFLVASVVLNSMGSNHLMLDIALHTAVMGLSLFVLMRLGLLAAVGMWFFDWCSSGILTLDPSSWTWATTLVNAVVLLLVAAAAATVALGGRSLLDEPAPVGPAAAGSRG